MSKHGVSRSRCQHTAVFKTEGSRKNAADIAACPKTSAVGRDWLLHCRCRTTPEPTPGASQSPAPNFSLELMSPAHRFALANQALDYAQLQGAEFAGIFRISRILLAQIVNFEAA
jgi:hypothetical protein